MPNWCENTLEVSGKSVKEFAKKAINIKWEKDGQNIDLPSEVELPIGIVDCGCLDLNCDN